MSDRKLTTLDSIELAIAKTLSEWEARIKYYNKVVEAEDLNPNSHASRTISDAVFAKKEECLKCQTELQGIYNRIKIDNP